MVKAIINVDERYPDYSFSGDDFKWGREIEVSEETLSRWRNACAEYARVQDEMERAYDASIIEHRGDQVIARTPNPPQS